MNVKHSDIVGAARVFLVKHRQEVESMTVEDIVKQLTSEFSYYFTTSQVRHYLDDCKLNYKGPTSKVGRLLKKSSLEEKLDLINTKLESILLLLPKQES